MANHIGGKGGRPKGYPRSGGRKKGTRNKATMERAEMAKRQLVEARKPGVKLGKDQLSEIMGIAISMAAFHQPQVIGKPPPEGEVDTRELRYRTGTSAAEYKEFLKMAMDAAKAVAPYQSATYRATIDATPDTLPMDEEIVYRLHAFDSGGRPLNATLLPPDEDG